LISRKQGSLERGKISSGATGCGKVKRKAEKTPVEKKILSSSAALVHTAQRVFFVVEGLGIILLSLLSGLYEFLVRRFVFHPFLECIFYPAWENEAIPTKR
jgi:hypothetical protein